MSEVDWNADEAAEVIFNRYKDLEPFRSLWSMPIKSELLPENEPIYPHAIRIVAISDTHSHRLSGLNLPKGDILVHCGDLTKHGTEDEMRDLNNELALVAPLFRKIVIIAGNHDSCLGTPEPACRKSRAQSLLSHCTYLLDDSVTLFGLKFYGSPWIPPIEGDTDHVFLHNRGKEMDQHWGTIPDDVDVLITHAPPLGVLDVRKTGIREGCLALLNHSLNRIKPRFHLFGHMHGGHGVLESTNGVTTFVNAALCYYSNEIRYRPVVFDIPLPQNQAKD